MNQAVTDIVLVSFSCYVVNATTDKLLNGFSFFQLLHVNGAMNVLVDYIVLVSFSCYRLSYKLKNSKIVF